MFFLYFANLHWMSRYTRFFNKEPVYKQLALGWKIAKQHFELNPLLLSNSKWGFSFVINVKSLLNQQNIKIQLS